MKKKIVLDHERKKQREDCEYLLRAAKFESNRAAEEMPRTDLLHELKISIPMIPVTFYEAKSCNTTVFSISNVGISVMLKTESVAQTCF